jgi:outer membrane protein
LSDTLDGLAQESSGDRLPATKEEAVQLAMQNRPELVAAMRQTEAAGYGISAAKSAYAPQVYAVAMADGSVGQESEGSRGGYTIGLTMSLPIWDGGQRRSDTDAAAAHLDRVRADAAKVRRDVEQEALSACLRYQAATARIAVAQAGLTAAEQGYTLANLRYNAGKSVTAERLDALAALTRSQSNLASAKADRVIAGAKLKAAMGVM